MPITRVPVIHRFGIISHSKRLELQERLAKKVIEEGVDNEKRPTTSLHRKNQFMIDENFVNQYNETEAESEERQQLHDKAEKIFARAKRKAGIKEGGIGSHVSLTQAWIDLSLLAQCNSRLLQDAALKSLYNSLSYSPISRNHVESLLRLAHDSIQWITESSIGQPYLRTGEIRLLKVAHLVFLRLYYHHLAGDIVGLRTERMQLTDIVQAIEHEQNIYRPFPSSLLLIRIIIHINGYLKRSLEDELKLLVQRESEDSSRRRQMKSGSANLDGFAKDLLTKVERGISPEFDGNLSQQSLFHDVTNAKSEERRLPDVPTIHDTSPTLWHSLDLWRILTHTHQNIDVSLKELIVCSLDFTAEPLLDSILALHVLAEVSKLNYDTLHAMQFIARRDVLGLDDDLTNNKRKPRNFRLLMKDNSTGKPAHDFAESFAIQDGNFLNEFAEEAFPFSTPKAAGDTGSENTNGLEESSKTVPSFINRLDEFLNPKPMGKSNRNRRKQNKEQDSSLARKDTMDSKPCISGPEGKGQRSDAGERCESSDHGNKGQKTVLSEDDLDEYASHVDDTLSTDGSLADVSSLASNQPPYEGKARTSKRRTKRRPKGSGREVFSSDDSEVDLDGNENDGELDLRRESSLFIKMADYRDEQNPTSPGQTITRPNTQMSASTTTRWPWELVVSYVRSMGEICAYGNKSQIQRDALMGCHGKEAGLLQMLKFQMPIDRDANYDWSWRVRHVAVHELIKICQLKQNKPLRDGLQNSAWTALLSHHSLETDRRVLEAYKIARIEASMEAIEESLIDATSKQSSSIYSRISTNLAIIHLTPLQPEKGQRSEGDAIPLRKEARVKGDVLKSGERSDATREREPMRVSLRNEILIASTLEDKIPAFGRRTWKDVQTVVEDQWKKELLEEYDIVDKQKQEKTDKEITSLRKSLKTESLKERV